MNSSDGSQVERHSWINGDGCVAVEELKIINGGHDWPSPLSSWGNQDINASAEVWKFVSKYDMDGLIGCNTTNLPSVQSLNSKNHINIVDIFGRKSKRLKNQLLIYIYDDGTTEKKIIIE